MLDPETITDQNRTRREENSTLPLLKFYAVVQHEGEVMIWKRHIPHAVVSIGQSFSVERSFLEQQHAPRMWGDQAEKDRKCTCNDGCGFRGKPTWGLDLRQTTPDPKAGIEGHPAH